MSEHHNDKFICNKCSTTPSYSFTKMKHSYGGTYSRKCHHWIALHLTELQSSTDNKYLYIISTVQLPLTNSN